MPLKFRAVYSDSRALVRPTLTKCDDSKGETKIIKYSPHPALLKQSKK